MCYNEQHDDYIGVNIMISNLSTLMGKYRYTIKDVHERTGLSRTTISSLYNDKATRIDYSTIEKLCVLFECGVENLLLLDINEQKNKKFTEE